MKKIIVLLSILLLAGCAANNQIQISESTAPASTNDAAAETTGNFSNEMKIPHNVDLEPEAGADMYEREGDHPDSIYFAHPDFYNMESTDTLTILPHFQTHQQTSEWSCGVDAAYMVLNYQGKLGDNTVETLAEMRTNGLAYEATSLESVIDIFENIGGYELHSTYDYSEDEYDQINLDMIQDYLKQGIPVLVAWNDWGGHWQVIIGYDTMGTETYSDDVIIVADSYDTTDHNQDGYGIYGAERFYYNWTMYDFFTANYGINERDYLFLAPVPVE